MAKDLVKLLVFIVLLAIISVGIYFAGKSVDNKSKYQHPITRPGASW